MGRSARVALTAKQVENSTKLGYTADGKQPGLNLQVAEGAHGIVRSWVFRYTSPTTGKRREFGLGSVRQVSLAEARIAAAEAGRLVAGGIDPKDERDAEKKRRQIPVRPCLTFEDAAAQCIAARQHEWKNQKHRRQWSASLKTYAYPVIGSVPVDQPESLRVPDSDCVSFWGGPWGEVGRNRPYCEGMDDTYRTDEGGARTPGAIECQGDDYRQ